MARRKEITPTAVVDVAHTFITNVGYNGFSTRELADELGISSASLHHHFATKGDLAAAVIGRARERANERLAVIAAEVEGFARRVQFFSDALRPEATFLAMSAGDFPTLPVVAQSEVRQLFTNLLGWLGRFAMQARADGELDEDAVPETIASQILGEVIGGAMLQRVASQGSPPVPPVTWSWQR